MSHQYDVDEERRNRFLTTGADTPRSTSQPPTTNGDGFYSSAAMQIFGSPGGHTNASLSSSTSSSSPWAISSGRLSRSASIGAPASLPRASSFSARDYAAGSFSHAVRENHPFPSTFEDDESEAMSDVGGPVIGGGGGSGFTADSMAYSYSYGAGETRGRAVYGVDARSRSQSLAAASATRPGPVGSPPTSGGWAGAGAGATGFGSTPLSIPGRFGDIKPPTSRYGSLGGRLAAGGMSPSPTGLRPGGYGHTHAELTNISPLARDVGQILLDEENWALNGGESGTTSRRHSVSIVQPRRGIVGFNAPEHLDDYRGGQSAFYGGMGSGGASLGGGGGLAISDDELAGLTGSMLTLNNNNNNNHTYSSARHELPPSQPSSLPIYAPLSRPSLSTTAEMDNLSVHHAIGGGVGDHSGIPRHMLRSPSESNQSASSGGGSGSSPARTAEHSLSPRPQDHAIGQQQQQQQQQQLRPRPSDIRTDVSPQALHMQLSAAQAQLHQLQQQQQQQQQQASMRFNAAAAEHGFGYGAPPSPSLLRSGGGGQGQGQGPNHSFMQMQTLTSPLSPLSPSRAPAIGRRSSLSQVGLGGGIGGGGIGSGINIGGIGGMGGSGGIQDPNSATSDLGRGIPLHAVPPSWALYLVEFKGGRTDLFYVADPSTLTGVPPSSTTSLNLNNGNGNGNGSGILHVGDLVIVEADRGRDLGRIVDDTLTAEAVEAVERAKLAAAQSNAALGVNVGGGIGGGEQQMYGAGGVPGSPDVSGPPLHGKREISPKKIYGKATAQDIQLLAAKQRDESKALALCQSKVEQKKLPMKVIDAEYQWDRRKLTFYFVAEKRIDFRELVRELFRLYKTRIWMASLQGPTPPE